MPHILIVDDYAPIRETLRLLLEEAGFRITEASNGNEGIRSYRSNPADLIITDIHMPGKNGVEMLSELSTHYPGIKSIAISADTVFKSHEEKIIAATNGCVKRTFAKPFQASDILKAIRQILN